MLLVLSNGPVLRFALGVANSGGAWSDHAVWPFFAAAAVASALLACHALASRRARGRAPRTELSRGAIAATVCFSAAAVLSSLWSVAAGETLWRSVVYLGLALGGVALACFGDRELADTLAMFAAAAVGLSLAVIVLRPDVGLDHNGDWIGVYDNRNSLAPAAAIGALAALSRLLDPESAARGVRAASGARARRGERRARAALGAALGSSARGAHAMPGARRLGWAALCLACVVTMAGAGSRTAWLALFAGLGAATVLLGAAVAGSRRARLGWGAGVLGVVAVLAASVAVMWDAATLAQRRTIWAMVWERVLERPVGGHGFFVFWEVPELVSGSELLQRGSAHNSLIETALGLGLLGAVPFTALAVLAAVNAARCLWRRPSALTWMWAAVTVFVLVENSTESFVLWFSHIWVLLVAAALRAPATVSPPEPRGNARGGV